MADRGLPLDQPGHCGGDAFAVGRGGAAAGLEVEAEMAAHGRSLDFLLDRLARNDVRYRFVIDMSKG